MRRGGAGLLVAVLALVGCKGTDSKPVGKEPSGTATARTRTKDGKDSHPKWLDPSARLPGSDTAVPKAKNWGNDPSNPNFNAKAEAQDAVGGKVVDASGRPAKIAASVSALRSNIDPGRQSRVSTFIPALVAGACSRRPPDR